MTKVEETIEVNRCMDCNHYDEYLNQCDFDICPYLEEYLDCHKLDIEQFAD